MKFTNNRSIGDVCVKMSVAVKVLQSRHKIKGGEKCESAN